MSAATPGDNGEMRAMAQAAADLHEWGENDNSCLCGWTGWNHARHVADAVLDALGLAQVGWYSPTGGAFWLGVHGVRGAEAVPAYRLTALGSSEVPRGTEG